MARKHIIVHGMVQGVGFRFFTVRQADALGVAGWVRNLRDDTVEIEAQADAAVMDTFVAAVRKGPSFSRVRSLDITDMPDSPRTGAFEVRL